MFSDCVVDIETGGLDPCRSLVLQIGAVKFNRQTREVCHDFFNRSLLSSSQPNRYWDEDTRNFWLKRKEVLYGLMQQAKDTKLVLEEFRNWVGPGVKLWAKPSHFEHPFMQSLYKDCGMQIPFFYRDAEDINSFARGRYWPETPPNWERLIPFEGDMHDGLADALHELKVIYKLLDKEIAHEGL